MANNVLFKKGYQADLASAKVVKDSFYLTEDTRRLYIGTDEGIALLNSSIAYYNSASELKAASKQFAPAQGDIAFVAGEYNALMYNTNGTADGWVQINPNDNDNNYFKNKSASFVKKDEDPNDPNSVTYELTLIQIDEKNAETEVKASFKISAEDLGAIIADDTMSATAITNGANIKLDNDTDDGVNLKAGDNVTISVSGDDITISSSYTNTTYDLTSPASDTKIHLIGNDNSDDAVEIAAGSQISVDGSVEGKITINHGAIEVTKTPVNDGTKNELAHEEELTVVDSITIGDNGHVTGYTTKTYVLPEDKDATNASATAEVDNEGTITITVTDSLGNTVTGIGENNVYVTVGTETVYNQGDILDTQYFKDLNDQIDGIAKDLSGIDALRYRGVVDGETPLPSSNIQRGDTYKVGVAGTYGGVACQVGDLLIAIGDEDDDGYITTVEWTHIAAGDDTDTTYDLIGNATTNSIQLVASTGGSDDIKIIEGKDIEAKVAAATADAPASLSINHKTVTRNDGNVVDGGTVAHEGTFTVVTGVTSDNGHVTAVETTEFTLPKDNDTKYTLPVDTENGGAKVTLTGTDNSTDSVRFHVGSTNTSLAVSVEDEDKIVYKHADYDFENPDNVTASGELTHEGALTVVTGAIVENGHITALTTSTYTLPADNDTTYELSGSTVAISANAATITSTLTGSDNKTTNSEVTVSSETLTISAVANNDKAYMIDLTWGSFND